MLAVIVFILSVSSAILSAATPVCDDSAAPGARELRQLVSRQTFPVSPTTPAGGFHEVGSSAWSAAYPSNTPSTSSMPATWKNALAAAEEAGLIPNIAPSHQDTPNGNPTYRGLDPTNPGVCSATYGCRIPGSTQIWDAPEGVFGVSFDDGPLPTSAALYSFLHTHSVQATHFYIGVNILVNPSEFQTALSHGDNLEVHTWTHPYMTTLSNADVVAQLGYTQQLIYESSGGTQVPKFWRPPYGDTDVRVTAIAKEVFGLTTVLWNHDSEDWSIGQPNGATPQDVAANFNTWLTGSKSPGLIVLEHELSTASVQTFIDAFPSIQQNGWTLRSVAELQSDVTQ